MPTTVSDPPAILAVASIHPDYLEACVEGCCTGARYPCRFPPGTVTLVRRTAAGGKQGYGVVGIWYYTGESRQLARAEFKWPRRWNWRIGFRPLILRFQEPFREEFSLPIPGKEGSAAGRASALVPGLLTTQLQGVMVRVGPQVSANYLRALLKARGPELKVRAEYLGRQVQVDRLLARLAERLEEEAAHSRPSGQGAAGPSLLPDRSTTARPTG